MKQKNKKILIGVLLVVVIVLGTTGVYARKKRNDNLTKAHNLMMAHEAAMKHDQAMAQEKTAAGGDAMKHDEAMAHGNYISLADYNKAKDSYTDSKKVLFFHASWCPICQSIDKSITADPTKLPAKTAIIKTDYDTETALKQQYGITQQYTFVQIDNSGNQIKKWSATTLADVLSNIQ